MYVKYNVQQVSSGFQSHTYAFCFLRKYVPSGQRGLFSQFDLIPKLLSKHRASLAILNSLNSQDFSTKRRFTLWMTAQGGPSPSGGARHVSTRTIFLGKWFYFTCLKFRQQKSNCQRWLGGGGAAASTGLFSYAKYHGLLAEGGERQSAATCGVVQRRQTLQRSQADGWLQQASGVSSDSSSLLQLPVPQAKGLVLNAPHVVYKNVACFSPPVSFRPSAGVAILQL